MKLAAKIITALTVGAASISIAHAGWETIDATRSWNPDSVQVNGHNRTFFIKQTKSGKTPKGKRYAMTMVAQTIDCSSFSIRVKSVAFFDGQGNRVDGVEIPLYAQREETIFPDTIGEDIAQTVCGQSDGNAATSTQRRSELVHLQALTGGKASPGYADRVRRRVQPNIAFTGDVEGNPSAVVTVSLASDGSLLSARLSKSSGDSAWDNAVLRAVERSDPLPRDESGKAPSNFTITFRPKD